MNNICCFTSTPTPTLSLQTIIDSVSIFMREGKKKLRFYSDNLYKKIFFSKFILF